MTFSMHNKLAIGVYRGILSSLDAVVHCEYEQCDTAPYIIGSIRSRYSSSTLVPRILLRITGTTYIWHQEILRTVGMERNEVRPPVSYVAIYIPCSKKYKFVWYIYLSNIFGVLL